MSWVTAAVIVGGSQLASAYMGSKAAQSAADTQAQAAREAAGVQKQIFDIQNAQQAPGRAAGYQSYNMIRSLLPGTYTKYDEQGNPIGNATGTDYLTHQFTPEDFAAGIDPSYAWRLKQGQMATQRAANTSGGALSGNTLAGLEDYTQNLASTEYGNAFNRYQTQRSNIYNTLASIAGLGQSAQGQTNQAASAYGTNAANLITGAAGAQAAGTVGAANAWGNAAQNIGNSYMLSQLVNKNPAMAAPTGYGTPAPQLDVTVA